MLTRIYLVVFVLLTSISYLNAQVTFEEFSSFEKMVSKAKKEKKLIFVQVASESCSQCNEVAHKGLSSAALKEKFEVNFISTSIPITGDLYKQIAEKTNILGFVMGSLFLDQEGFLLLKIGSTTSYSMSYLNYADQAINLSKNNPLKPLEAQYQKGERNKTLLAKLIQEKAKLDFDTYDLVEEYIDVQTIKELNTLDNAKLLLEQGLPLESRARKLLYALFPSKTMDSLFRSYPLELRVRLNNKIISSSRNMAIKKKDKTLAMQLQFFIQGTYEKNWEKGSFAGQSFINGFYKDIKDTTEFLRSADSFCSYNLMNISVDTLIKREEKERNAILSQKRQQQSNAMMSFTYTPYYIRYAAELNNMAFGVFTFTNDLEKLAKALKWSKRAMEINEALVPDESRKQNPAFMDTYACLLFRLGKKEEAIDWETKAIEVAKKYGDSTRNIENTLGKIKNGTL